MMQKNTLGDRGLLAAHLVPERDLLILVKTLVIAAYDPDTLALNNAKA